MDADTYVENFLYSKIVRPEVGICSSENKSANNEQFYYVYKDRSNK